MSKAVLMQGNEAAVEGAIAAGMRFFAGYPITPSTEIAEQSALRLPQMGGKFIQMEDEISSIAAVLGASAAGMKAMTATSGPGFSLMQENIGYGVMAEIPCVIVDVQRAGPSTGLATSPSQGDYMQAKWGTHGDHPVIALYLSEYNEMFSDIFGQTGQNADESIFELQFRSSNANNTGLDQMYFRYNNASSNGYGYLKAASVYGKVDATGNGVWTNSVDQRLYEFLYDAASTSTEQFGVRKFVATTSAGINNTADSKRDTRANVYQNWILYRLTDVMLMKAEALVQLYNLGGKAEGDNRNEQAFAICQYINNRSLSDANKSSYAMKYSVYKDKMEELVLAERARELCFEGKRWFDLMRYNYRHTATKANLKQKLSDENYTIVTNSEAFYELALRKYAVPTTMKAKIRDERYLYMPINQDEVEINTNLVQNPVYKSASKY